MGRPVVLSNGQLFVGLDENGLVQDFYYPYVGLENLTTARSIQHKIGVWVDGQFSWTNDGSWNITIAVEENALIGRITMESAALQLTIQTHDFVDTVQNAFIRQFKITNNGNERREVRLFNHQVFQISRGGRADTALYVPGSHYLLDYKGAYCLLIGGKTEHGSNFDQYAVGNYGIEGKAGTYLDAEDGELSNNPVEHGGVDSVIRFVNYLKPGESVSIDYWIIAASSQSDAQVIHNKFKRQEFANRLQRVRQGWHDWVKQSQGPQHVLENPNLKHSMFIIKAHCDERGSVLASGDSSIYNYGRDYYCYCWPRDAVYATLPLVRLGHLEEAKNFINFAQDTRHKDGYLMHKYQPDRAVGSTWHPLVHGRSTELAIQEDETASVLLLIWKIYEAEGSLDYIKDLYHTFISPCANFMTHYVDEETGLPHASYDLWESKFMTSTYTVCTVIAGLEAAAKIAAKLDKPHDQQKWNTAADKIRQNLDKLYHPDGYFRKGFLLQTNGDLLYDDVVDISSLFGAYKYAGLKADDERILNTAKKVEERLLNTSPSGGVIRFEDDVYFLSKSQYKGNPWIVCTLWLAQYYLSVGRNDEGRQLLEWAYARVLPGGALSEQFDPESATPLGVTPLVWSQAELLNTILDIG